MDPRTANQFPYDVFCPQKSDFKGVHGVTRCNRKLKVLTHEIAHLDDGDAGYYKDSGEDKQLADVFLRSRS